jgi:hypothetical protein
MNIDVEYNSKSNELCAIMAQAGSDKGCPDNKGHHTYTLLYHALFNPVRDQAIRVFELGLGTNNISIPSNMGINGIPGASLRGWREFFPKGQIFGADIDKDILFKEDRIETFYCDQLSKQSIHELWSQPSLNDNFDIIIIDGLHTFEADCNFVDHSIHKLKKGGILVVEDIYYSTISMYTRQTRKWSEQYPDLRFRLEPMGYCRNTIDNVLLIIQRSQ